MSGESGQIIPTADYKARLDAILDVPLTPETIDGYAHGALNSVVSLVVEYTEAYQKETSEQHDTGLEAETAAAAYWGLRDVGEVLDHLSETSEKISGLTQLIGKSACHDYVVVPPDPAQGIVEGGVHKFERKNTIARLKTTLFILQNDFGIDIHNPSELRLAEGEIAEDMMRRESYFGINVPTLERLILICDEEGNASYVFDSAKLAELGINEDTLLQSGKQAYKALLEKHGDAGRRVVYTENFTDNVSKAIVDPTSVPGATAPKSYLHPRAENGILSAKGMAKKLGVSQQVVWDLLQELGDGIGPVSLVRFGAVETNGYDAVQQDMVAKILEERGYFVAHAPEEVLSGMGMSKEWGITKKTIYKVINEIADQLGEVQSFRFGSGFTEGYTVEQQAKIKERLRELGYFDQAPPDGFLTVKEIAECLGVSDSTVRNMLKELKDTIGETVIIRIKGSAPRGFYSPEQQTAIEGLLRGKGTLAEKPPAGVLSLLGMAKEWGIDQGMITAAIQDLGEELGEITSYLFKTKYTSGYSLGQQNLIQRRLQESGAFSLAAPEGYLSFSSIAALHENVSAETIKTVISELGEALGETNTYRFGPRIVTGYSPEQQKQITERLRETGRIDGFAPEGYRSVKGMSQWLGAHHTKLVKIVEELRDSIGEIGMFRFGSAAYTRGFSPEQQRLIAEKIQEHKSRKG